MRKQIKLSILLICGSLMAIFNAYGQDTTWITSSIGLIKPFANESLIRPNLKYKTNLKSYFVFVDSISHQIDSTILNSATFKIEYNQKNSKQIIENQLSNDTLQLSLNARNFEFDYDSIGILIKTKNDSIIKYYNIHVQRIIPYTKLTCMWIPPTWNPMLSIGKEYRFKIEPCYFWNFYYTDSTWVDTVINKSIIKTEINPIYGTDIFTPIGFDTVTIYQIDTIPAHWNVNEYYDTTSIPQYSIYGKSSNLTNSYAYLKDNDTLVLWVNELQMSESQSEIYIQIKTQYDTVVFAFGFAPYNDNAVYKELQSFQSEAIIGEKYYFEAQKGITEKDSTFNLVLDIPMFIDSVEAYKSFRRQWYGPGQWGDSLLVFSIKGNGVVPSDSSKWKSTSSNYQLKNESILKSFDYNLVFKAEAVNKTKSYELFNVTVPLKNGITAIKQLENQQFKEGIKTDIYTLNGVFIKSIDWNSDLLHNLTNGIYILKQGVVVRKIAIIR